MPEAIQEDRRRSGRKHVEIPLTILVDATDPGAKRVLCETTTIDCSDEGARLFVNIAGLRPGNTLSLRMLTSQELVPSRVVWVQPPGPNSIGELGVQFLQGLQLRYEM